MFDRLCERFLLFHVFVVGVYYFTMLHVRRCAWEWDSQWDRESHGNPMGMRIKHRIGNGNGREWETTSVGKGITCTPMGIFSQRFYAGLKLVSAGSGECRDTNVDLGNKTKSNGHR